MDQSFVDTCGMPSDDRNSVTMAVGEHTAPQKVGPSIAGKGAKQESTQQTIPLKRSARKIPENCRLPGVHSSVPVGTIHQCEINHINTRI